MSKAEYKIEAVINITKVARETAVAYLEAEEWDIEDAVMSIRTDIRREVKVLGSK